MRRNIFEIGKFFPLNEKFKWGTRNRDNSTYKKCSFEGEVRVLLEANEPDNSMVLKYKKVSDSTIIEVTNINEAFIEQFTAQFAPNIETREAAVQKAVERFATLLKARSFAIQQRSKGMVIIPKGSRSLLRLDFVECEDYNIDTFREYKAIPENEGCIIVNEALLIFPESVISKPPTVKASVRGCDYLAKLKIRWDHDAVDYRDSIENAVPFWTKEGIHRVFGVSVEGKMRTEEGSLMNNDVVRASRDLNKKKKEDIVEPLPVLDLEPESTPAPKPVDTSSSVLLRVDSIHPDRMPGVSVYTVIDEAPVFAVITHYVYTRTLSSDSVWLMANGKLVKKKLSEVFTDKIELSKWFSNNIRELPNQELVRI